MRQTGITGIEIELVCGCWLDLATGETSKCDSHSDEDFRRWAEESMSGE